MRAPSVAIFLRLRLRFSDAGEEIVRSEKSQNERSRHFSNFRPEFCPEFCSEFSLNFLRNFRASFRGKRRPEKNHQKSPAFLNAISPGKPAKKIHKSFLGGGQSKIAVIVWAPRVSLPPRKPCDFPCDRKSLAIAILFVIFQEEKYPHCGLAGDGDVCDKKSRRFAIAISGARS